jgi:hypothetical protein
VIAHVGGVPLEEILPSIAGAGAGLLLTRAWLMLHLRRLQRTGELVGLHAARLTLWPASR